MHPDVRRQPDAAGLRLQPMYGEKLGGSTPLLAPNRKWRHSDLLPLGAADFLWIFRMHAQLVTRITPFCDLDHRLKNNMMLQVSRNVILIAFPGKAQLLKDIEHLARLAAVMLIVFAAFVIVRTAIVPKSFGQYGHFRGAAIAEIASKPIVHAGHQNCETCHTDVFEKKGQGKHVVIACEACHGGLANHADDPSIHPTKLEAVVVCSRCHEENSAKPKWFPQVMTADHANGLACDSCHQPHTPKIEALKIAGKEAGGKH